MRHCQHKRKASNRALKKTSTLRNKKTECPSHFTLKVHNHRFPPVSKQTTYLCQISLQWGHNHATTCAKALSFRPISKETINQMHTYFEQGHSPSSALHLHHLNLAIEHDSKDGELDLVLADRSLNPIYSDIYYIYKKWRIKQHGEPNGEKMFERLAEVIKDYNDRHNSQGGKALLQKFEKTNDKTRSEKWDAKAGSSTDTPLVLAVCTPLMARAHTMLRQAGELAHCDSTASLDRYNCPTFVMSTASSAGGIPLGVVITSGESEDTLTESFSHLRSVFPPQAFFGRGTTGPQMFITDDSDDTEKSALKTIWPEAKQLLCIFHYLQCWWKWLWDNNHAINKEDRQPIMHIIRSLVYQRNEVELEKQLEASSPESFAARYPQLVTRLEVFWERRREWSLASRALTMTRGNDTNNYAEAGIRVLKEIVFGRVKAYNLLQMFDFVTTTMEIYYSTRLLDIAHSRYRPGTLLWYKQFENLQNHISSMNLIRDNIYVVQESKDDILLDYLVDMEIGICSCPIGSSGAACRHQAAVAKQFKLISVNVAPVHSKEMRYLFAVIARGKENTQGVEFYADLVDTIEDATQTTKFRVNHVNSGEHTTSTDLHESDLIMDDQDDQDNTHSSDSRWSDYADTYRDKLCDIVEDLTERIIEGDHNVLSGVNKFIQQYKLMTKSHAPSSSIAYALHNFGKSDSKLVF